MDRFAVTQVVAMLVVLSALVRWLPDRDPRDPLGLGDPWRALELDRELIELGPDSDAARVRLRLLQRPPADHATYGPQFARTLKRVREIQASADDETFVQFRGVPRNDMWALMYLLYPLRFSFTSWEEGSRHDEPPLPGAETIDVRVTHWSDMPREALQYRAELGR